jgi:hypothetical protein
MLMHRLTPLRTDARPLRPAACLPGIEQGHSGWCTLTTAGVLDEKAFSLFAAA